MQFKHGNQSTRGHVIYSRTAWKKKKTQEISHIFKKCVSRNKNTINRFGLKSATNVTILVESEIKTFTFVWIFSHISDETQDVLHRDVMVFTELTETH